MITLSAATVYVLPDAALDGPIGEEIEPIFGSDAEGNSAYLRWEATASSEYANCLGQFHKAQDVYVADRPARPQDTAVRSLQRSSLQLTSGQTDLAIIQADEGERVRLDLKFHTRDELDPRSGLVSAGG